MTIPASAELIAHLEGEVTTLARLLHVTRGDGTEYFYTDAVQPIVYGGDTYRADISFTSSAIFQSSSAGNAQTLTVESVMDDAGFKEADVRARLYDAARVDILVINYASPADGAIQKFRGKIGRIKVTDKNRIEFEVLTDGASGGSGGTIPTEKYSATCRASLGDARCGINIEALKVTITVDSASGQVISASELTQAENHWQYGFLKWLTGVNAGQTSPIASSNLATNSVTLSGTPLQGVSVGDTADVYPGCDKTLRTCVDRYNNLVNMRAEPYVPSNVTINTEELEVPRGLPA